MTAVVPAKCGPFNLAGVAELVSRAQAGDVAATVAVGALGRICRRKDECVLPALVDELAGYAGEEAAAALDYFTAVQR